MVAQAIKNNQAMLAFQPVVIAGDPGRVGFYEGLIRVLDETGRIIPAREFMPIVERAELGREIDVVALNLGLKTLHRNPSLRLSINMSARSIGYHRWMQTLQRWVKKDSTLGERLILEITESSAMDQPELVIDFMARLRKSNISFALDDFGSGYTALKYLKNFLFDVLKIDMLFCDGIAEDPDMQILTRAIADIGQHFDMLVAAEGVERQADAEITSSGRRNVDTDGCRLPAGLLFRGTKHPTRLAAQREEWKTRRKTKSRSTRLRHHAHCRAAANPVCEPGWALNPTNRGYPRNFIF